MAVLGTQAGGDQLTRFQNGWTIQLACGLAAAAAFLAMGRIQPVVARATVEPAPA